MLCHRRLIEGESLQAQLKTVLFDAVPAPSSCRPDLPAELERLTMTLLEKDRERRYRNAAAAIAAPIDYSALPPPRSRRKTLAAVLASALAAGVAGGMYMRSRDGRPDGDQGATSPTSTLGAMPSNAAPTAVAPSMPSPQPPSATEKQPEHLIEAKQEPSMLVDPAAPFAAGSANVASEPATAASSLTRRASPTRSKSPATSSEKAAAPDSAWVRAKGDVVQFKDD